MIHFYKKNITFYKEKETISIRKGNYKHMEKKKLGILGGMGYYLGEYNPNRHFDRSQRYLGGFCRYNLNNRFALRLNAGFSKIDIRERSLLSNGETVYPAGFHCTVKDVAAWIEFEFLSFGCRK